MIDDLDEIQLIDAELAPQKQVVGRLKQAEVASNEDNMFNFTHQKVQIPKLDENDDFDEIDQIAQSPDKQEILVPVIATQNAQLNKQEPPKKSLFEYPSEEAEEEESYYDEEEEKPEPQQIG